MMAFIMDEPKKSGNSLYKKKFVKIISKELKRQIRTIEIYLLCIWTIKKN